MAIGWLTALKAIPWTDVISTAPVVVDGAKKLWHSVGKRPAPPKLAPVPPPASPEAQSGAALLARIAALEAEQAAISTQLADGTLYAKAPAEASTLSQRHAAIDDQLLAALERQDELGNG